MSTVAIIDYGVGNLRSVVNAFNYIGAKPELVSDPQRIFSYQKILLPGVGSFRHAMEKIRKAGLDKALHEHVLKNKTPVLGICLGMQILGNRSTEDGETKGLGFISCEVERFDFSFPENRQLKIPHVGFNSVKSIKESKLFRGLTGEPDYYFTHSYRMQCNNSDVVAGICNYGEDFVAAIEYGHIAATQFHPAFG